MKSLLLMLALSTAPDAGVGDGKFRTEVTSGHQHCWHDSGAMTTGLPPCSSAKCCHCGLWERTCWPPPDTRQHGSFR
ncbi:MAG: hypothetical protein RLZZ403_1880 [Pseudomonadota bacterium]|jgi:hypothetical protein